MDEVDEILASEETAPSPLPPPPLLPPPLPPSSSSSSSSDYESESEPKPLPAIRARSLLHLPAQRSTALAKSRDIYDVPSSESEDGGDKGPRLGRLG